MSDKDQDKSKEKKPEKKEQELPQEILDWNPKTDLGKKVKAGEFNSFDEVIDSGRKIMEPEIVDYFFPELATDFVLIGQSKGKFGGGQRRVYKHTQKKIREGSRLKFTYLAVVGNRNGYLGIGKGSSRESLAARLRAVKDAKLNMIKIRRGCGSWECGCKSAHSMPFVVEGKSGSVRVELKPAPRGTGIVAAAEARKILEIAGLKDLWSFSKGDSRTRLNLAYAIFDALRGTMKVKMPESYKEHAGVE
jgi:small subunit ribosomal protein S5